MREARKICDKGEKEQSDGRRSQKPNCVVAKASIKLISTKISQSYLNELTLVLDESRNLLFCTFSAI